jgi:hypothetical protein
MKATLFVWMEDGLPYIAWIKDQALADKLEKMARTEWDLTYFDRRDYEIVDSNIKFDDDFYLSWLKEVM